MTQLQTERGKQLVIAEGRIQVDISAIRSA
jgi:hypothetical protein